MGSDVVVGPCCHFNAMRSWFLLCSHPGPFTGYEYATSLLYSMRKAVRRKSSMSKNCRQKVSECHIAPFYLSFNKNGKSTWKENQ